MFGFVGSHFEILVLAGFGLFAVTLGGLSVVAHRLPERR